MHSLITGGAGFIGTHLVARLAAEGATGVVLDNLHPQIHGPGAVAPDLPAGFTFVNADITDREAMFRAVASARADVIFHLAAETGTGQSMDLPARYCDVNVMGTAHLIEAVRAAGAPPRRIVLPSSRAIYGEGAYRTESGDLVVPPPRQPEALAAGRFQPVIAGRGPLTAAPTPEDLPAMPASIYASTKLMQEYLLNQAALTADWGLSAVRFQNVYGPGQSLRNPYTGVLSIFAQILMNGGELNIYEDGEIVRDFVFVADAVDALIKAAAVEGPPVVANIGAGEATSILHAARSLAVALGYDPDRMRITGDFRPGDIRHAVADITRAREQLGWTPQWSLERGIGAFATWAAGSSEFVR